MNGSPRGVHRLIGLDERDSWSAALDGLPHGFAHTWESCHAMSLSSGLATFLYCWELEGARVVCPLSERPFEDAIDIVTPFGFSGFTGVGNFAGFPQLWYEFARSQGWVCGYLQMNPLFESPFQFETNDLRSDKEVFVIDLRKEPEQVFAAMASGRRSLVRRWDRGGGSYVDDLDRLEAFGLAEIRGFLDRRDASQLFDIAEEAWSELLRAPNTLTFGAELGGEVRAVNMVGLGPTTADGLYMLSRPDGRDLTTPLIWEAILRLRDRETTLYNLGGGLRSGDGIEQFKRYLGGEPRPLHVLRQIYEPVTYARLCTAAGVGTHSADEFFPPYRKSLR